MSDVHAVGTDPVLVAYSSVQSARDGSVISPVTGIARNAVTTAVSPRGPVPE